MRWRSAICALFIGISLSGCALVGAEKDNRGGFLDKVADDVWMKADSKRMRALRALAIEASLARIAMIAPKSAPDRALLARRIGATTLRADVVRRCAFNEVLIPGQLPGEPCFFFDSVMVDYENALFDLALVALPLEDARDLITRVSGGIASVSVNPLQLVQALLDIGREAFRYGRVVGAIYRDTIELEVQVWLASPEFANAERARGMPEEFVVTDEKVAGLRGAYIVDNDNIPLWRQEMAALRAQGLQPVPSPRFLTQIYAILTYICGQIVSTTDDSYRECAQPKLTRGLPVLPAGTSTLFRGPIRVVTTTTTTRPNVAREQQLSQQLQDERRRREELQVQVDELKKKQQEQVAKLTRPDEWARYRPTLCVTDENTFGPRTQQAVRLFKAAINDRLATNVSDDLNADEKRMLNDASGKFTTCRRGMADPPRNPFEVGLFTFASPDEVNGVLRDALAKAKATKPGIYSPGPNDTFDFNRAVRELRSFYNLPPPSGMQNVELDDRLWLQSRK